MQLSRALKHYKRHYLLYKSLHDVFFQFLIFILGFSLGVYSVVTYVNDNFHCVEINQDFTNAK